MQQLARPCASRPCAGAKAAACHRPAAAAAPARLAGGRPPLLLSNLCPSLSASHCTGGARSAVVAAASPGDRDVSTRAAEVLSAPAAAQSVDEVSPSAASEAARWSQMSYSQQYNEIYSGPKPLNIKKIVPKPSRAAQAQEPGSGRVLLSDVHTTGKRKSFLGREWNATDLSYTLFIGGMHLLALAAPFTFSWNMVGLFFASYFVTGCLGITLSYHRQLSHKSFSTPKWVEYILAYCGVLAVQGDPLEWVSSHRYHHLHTDTPLDPHSPYEGFWWSHAGWLLDNEATNDRVYNRGNADEMESQWYYRFLRDTYGWHVAAQFLVLFLAGGLPAVVWGGALRMCWVWHITWFVNSACHVWGDQTYNTGDLSRNNWWVGLLAFGEGWHNNHHAFEFSARHGLEWWQLDMTWMCVTVLDKLGLASNIKLPSERQKAKLAFKPTPAVAA